MVSFVNHLVGHQLPLLSMLEMFSNCSKFNSASLGINGKSGFNWKSGSNTEPNMESNQLSQEKKSFSWLKCGFRNYYYT